MIYTGSRGQLGKNPNKKNHEKIIKIAALAFWEATLKKNQAAQNWLDSGSFSNYLGEETIFESLES